MNTMRMVGFHLYATLGVKSMSSGSYEGCFNQGFDDVIRKYAQLRGDLKEDMKLLSQFTLD